MRGNLDEDAGNVVHGTYVNGFYEEAPIATARRPTDSPATTRCCSTSPTASGSSCVVGDEPLDLSTGTVEAYERSLDLQTGS